MWGLCKFSFDFEYKDYILLHVCDLFVSASARMIIRKKSMNCVNAICICNKGHLHCISNTRYPIIKISKNCVAEELFQLGWKIMFVYDSWEYIFICIGINLSISGRCLLLLAQVGTKSPKVLVLFSPFCSASVRLIFISLAL